MTPYNKSIEYVNLNIGFHDFYEMCYKYWIFPSKITELKNKGYDEMWVLKEDKKDGQIIAVAKNGKIEIYSYFAEELLKIGGNKETFNKAFLPVVLEIDAILEKISKHGIESITDLEKNYLDKLYQ